MTVDLLPAFSQPSVYDGPAGRVHHGYSTAPAAVDAVPVLLSAEPVASWYAKLEPGGFIVPHVDQGPWRERWHYPISGVGWVWQSWEDESIPRVGRPVLPDGAAAPYRMNHHRPHAVWNPWTNRPDYRVVLIVEFDNPVDQPTTDLIIAPMIPQVQEMIDALR